LIPKIIWQTYKDPFDKLPDYAKEFAQTWIDMNPEYQYRYFDDAQAAEFVLDEYGQEIYDLFMNVPVGVMRGDMFRYLAVFRFGGVYADLDAKCLKPISSWMLDDKRMIVCPEHAEHFCQWTFAAEAFHPILGNVIGKMIDRLKNADYTKAHFVHYLTGPGVWTSAICEALGIPDSDPAGTAAAGPINEGLTESMLEFNESEKALSEGFYCYAGKDWRIFHWYAVDHVYGSQKWNDGQYVRWIDDDLFKQATPVI
jgi:hypothetical protein